MELIGEQAPMCKTAAIFCLQLNRISLITTVSRVQVGIPVGSLSRRRYTFFVCQWRYSIGRRNCPQPRNIEFKKHGTSSSSFREKRIRYRITGNCFFQKNCFFEKWNKKTCLYKRKKIMLEHVFHGWSIQSKQQPPYLAKPIIQR